MLPILKVLTLIFKVFSKPMITYTKKYHMARKNNHSNFSKSFLIYFGNKWHMIETMINRRFLNISQSDFVIKELSPNDALEKGLEYTYEIIFYFILICIPLYEMRKGSLESARKSKELNEKLAGIEKDLVNTKDLLIASNNKQNEELVIFASSFDKIKYDLVVLDESKNKIIKETEDLVNEVSLDSKALIDEIIKKNDQLERLFIKCQQNQNTLEKSLNS
jgi:Optic atrophy 3 protein (OPA3)